MQQVRQIAQDNQKESTEIQAKNYDKGRSSHNFKVGDKVLIPNVVQSSTSGHIVGGLTPIRRGVYIISKQLSENRFEISDLNKNVVGEFNADQITLHEEYDDDENEITTEEPQEINTPIENESKRSRGRPKKKVRGPARKTALAPQQLPEKSSQSRPKSNKEGIGQPHDTPSKGLSSENLPKNQGRGRPRKRETATLPTSDGQQDYQGPVSQAKDSSEERRRRLQRRNKNKEGGSPIRPKFTKIVF